jgi:hypothetical protein
MFRCSGATVPTVDRKWESAPATIHADKKKITAALPEGATVYYLNLFDDRDCAVGSVHEEFK